MIKEFTKERKRIMKTYVVAYLSFFDNDLKQIVVKAQTPLGALKLGVTLLLGSSSDCDENIDSAQSVEEFVDDFSSFDVAVSVIEVIDINPNMS